MIRQKPGQGSGAERSRAAEETAEKASKSRRENPMVLLARYSEIGFLIPAALFVGYLFGLLADHLLHTHWLYLVGIIFGAVAGFVSMIRRALQSSREADAEDDAAAEAVRDESMRQSHRQDRANGDEAGGDDEKRDGSNEQR